ncbi:outer membrane beta-barrel protein [Pontibacter akesuensis]|uniref:outer membrane beta-barrel protein n=1 Tax=Pontibacter akesuensis TaxID=388950 RepID=UPI00156049F8|nr:outer membrane beta-barrel protein [Pontibacter akesuensis]
MYKLSENAETRLGTVDSVQEFEIFNTVHKYQRATVNVDRSSENLRDISHSREPIFKQETLFLRVLVEGKATLYTYQGQAGFERFFYKTDSSAIEQLVYKKFIVEGTKFSENNAYRQQLYTTLKCPSFTPEQFNKIGYEKKELARLFVKYNECIGATYTNFSQRRQKKEFEISFRVKAGATYTSLKMEHHSGSPYVKTFDPEVLPSLGVEAEVILPFNKNQWALFADPTFQNYKNDHEAVVFGREAVLEVNYRHIYVPIGARRYFYLNNDSKIFLNGAFSLNYLLNASNAIEINNISVNAGFDHKSISSSWVVGAGYTYKRKYSVEAVYNIKRVIVDGRYWRNSYVNPFAVAVGYKLY